MNNLYIIQSLAYLPIIIGISIIGIIALIRQKGKGVGYFGVMSIMIAIWLTWQSLAQLNIGAYTDLIMLRLASATSVFLGMFFVLFMRDYTNKTKRKIILIVYGVSASILFVLNLTSLGITNVTVNESGLTINDVGIFYYVSLMVVVAFFIYGFVILIIDTKKRVKSDRTANYYIFIGFAQAVIITVLTTTLLAPYPASQILIPISLFILTLLTALAIIRHRLFDIRLVAVRALTYLLSIGLLATVYAFIAFNLANIFIENWSVSLKESFYALLAVILALTFAPIKKFFERVTNRIFFRDQYDSQALINKIGRILASEIDLDKVSHQVINELCTQIKIEKAEIVVFGEKQLFYENNVFKSTKDNIGQKELRKLGRTMLVRDDQQSTERKDLMQKYGISVSLALRTSERFIGYLLLSDKKSGDIYSSEDINVLKIIGSELSVAIQNALSYKEIQLFNETLTEKVRQRTAQLKSANDQLHLLDQAKDEFISMASHQLRTPLTTVKGYASMLDEGDFGKLTREQREKVELTLDGANRMARLIDDLLNVSRMDANRFFLEVTEVDIVKVVAEEIQQLQSMAESKKVAIEYTPPSEKIPTIRLDENKTRQVIMNLVDNAIHYSQPPLGGGEANVSLKANDKNIEFVVRDNGIGVPADVQKKLFTKMFRANNAKAARPDGTGLGLYLVKRVIEDEGGEIIFESVEGKGSTFGFKLPLAGVPKEVEEKSRKIATKVAATQKSE